MARGECSIFTNPKRGCCISNNETLLTIGLMISHQKRSCWETGPVGPSPWGWNTVVSGMFRSPFSTHFHWDKLPFSCFFTRGSLSNLAIAQWYHLSHVSAKKTGPETKNLPRSSKNAQQTISKLCFLNIWSIHLWAINDYMTYINIYDRTYINMGIYIHILDSMYTWTFQ